MQVTSKWKLHEKRFHAGMPNITLVFHPVYDQSTPENERFSKHTPSGRLEMQVTNPPVAESYELGKDYYFVSNPVPVETPTPAQ